MTLQALTPETNTGNTGQTPEPEVPADSLLPHTLYFLGTDNAGLTQVFRIERDGKTQKQLTFEPESVKDYDVSLADGSVAYVANNQLLLVNADGSDRRLVVDGGTMDENNPFLNIINSPVFSPDGQTLAYGYKGLNLYSLSSGASNLVIENQIEDSGGFPFPKELYWPERYSPDGTKLLITLGYYEGASAAIYDPASRGIGAADWRRGRVNLLRCNGVVRGWFQHLLCQSRCGHVQFRFMESGSINWSGDHALYQ